MDSFEVISRITGDINKVSNMIKLINNIPDIQKNPLNYVVEDIKPDTNFLWLEFGVYKGDTIKLIARNTRNNVYGFDSFEGLSEYWRPKYDKGAFSIEGEIPQLGENIILIKGLFQDTLIDFLKEKNTKISFIHIDSDLYSSAKYVLDTCKSYFNDTCYVVFDELVNFEYFESDKSELMALYDFIQENNITYKWIGMHGDLNLSFVKGIKGYYYPYHQNVAICFIKE